MLHIELVPAEIKHLVQEITAVTTVIKNDLKSGAVKTAEQYATTIVPATDPLYNSILTLVDKAIKTCTAIQADDWDGVEGRLARLVGQITAVKHGNQNGLGRYITFAQIVIDWILKRE